ncbi:Long-chain specific acyl-CoA dehydrogenase, mitochondrial [Galemys pyrenaicus]|uniref:Long-chain specific acyl-CoA dehydrogenase, mitochondrial n=1 Tax=Galemys pyrenaicus TaxID=202257 RepID=A0A8J6AHR2_GALPY|nr:Long-chain specific acyl-CoA dehydrogenase, mitochondrial [Galemys pyrenaicus]
MLDDKAFEEPTHICCLQHAGTVAFVQLIPSSRGAGNFGGLKKVLQRLPSVTIHIAALGQNKAMMGEFPLPLAAHIYANKYMVKGYTPVLGLTGSTQVWGLLLENPLAQWQGSSMAKSLSPSSPSSRTRIKHRLSAYTGQVQVPSPSEEPHPPIYSHSGAEGRLETPSAKSLTDIGTRRIFSTEHDIFRESVRKFFQEEVIPNHSEWEKAGEVSRELWEKAGKQGLLGVNIAEKHGGIGGDLYSAAILWEEQAYSNCTGPGFSLHSDIVMPYIANYGSEEQIKHFIPQMAAGKCIGAIAMTEPGAGSDLQGVRTNAKKDGSDWILNGSKVFITNGWLSDVVIVVAVTSREARSPAHGISLFLVENGMKGFIKGRKLHKMGLKAQDTAELFFEDVRLPASALLGEENKGFYYLMQELPQERLLISELAISACEFMFEETRNYVKQRKAFGKTVAHIQTVQHKLAELKTHICVTRAFVDSCLQLHEAKRLDSATASMAKYWASELQNSVAYDCVQLHGGWGYMWEYPIARAYVDARVQPIYGGTNEIMKELIAREIVRP